MTTREQDMKKFEVFEVREVEEFTTTILDRIRDETIRKATPTYDAIDHFMRKSRE